MGLFLLSRIIDKHMWLVVIDGLYQVDHSERPWEENGVFKEIKVPLREEFQKTGILKANDDLPHKELQLQPSPKMLSLAQRARVGAAL